MADRRHRILVVDDVKDWRQTLGGSLRDVGYEVVAAASTPEALEQLEQNEFDLALIDLSLDLSDETNTEGLNIAHKIQRNWPDTKSVIITGYGTPDVVREALQPDKKGRRLIEAYLSKDESENLVEVIDTLLGLVPED